MNYLKSGLTLFAVLGVGTGTALLAQVGLGATVGRGADVPWFDRSLAGAAGGITPSALGPYLCEACDAPRPWLSGEAEALAARRPDASGEARQIADGLESLTVPLLRVSDNQIVPVDIGQIESRPSRTALR
jgi:hypothetical protein